MAQTLKSLPAHATSHLGYSMTPVLSAQPPITTFPAVARIGMCSTGTSPPGGRGLRLALSPHLPGGRALRRGLPPAPLHLLAAAGPGLRSRLTTPPGGRGLRLAPHTTPSRRSCPSARAPTSNTTFPGGGRPRLALPPNHTTPSRRSRALACAPTGTTPPSGRVLRLAPPHTFFFCFSF